ncbi:hypothetical protein [Acinetobacter puyangensis]|uniref:hypothetical protein n=1 Tax=Acinetobacter puyangensis TaxID=1096779 RepID=UPI003A4D8D7C
MNQITIKKQDTLLSYLKLAISAMAKALGVILGIAALGAAQAWIVIEFNGMTLVAIYLVIGLVMAVRGGL